MLLFIIGFAVGVVSLPVAFIIWAGYNLYLGV